MQNISLPDPVMRDLQSRFGYLLNVKYGLQRSMCTLRKVPFEYEFEILKHLTPHDRCAIDVGANQGQTIDAIRLYHEDVKIYSFEPGKRQFDSLCKKFKSDKNLVLKNLGLGKSELSADLYVPYYRNFMYDGLSSFSEDRAALWLNESSVWRFNPKHLNVIKEECKIGLLDKYKMVPFFLKIHVQGFELDVIEGGVQTIREHLPVLLLANHEAADIWLRAEGWQQFIFERGKLTEVLENDMRIYNSIYLHPDSDEHSDLTSILK